MFALERRWEKMGKKRNGIEMRWADRKKEKEERKKERLRDGKKELTRGRTKMRKRNGIGMNVRQKERKKRDRKKVGKARKRI